MATLLFNGDARLQFQIDNDDLKEKAMRCGARKVAANDIERTYRLGPDSCGNQHMIVILSSDDDARHIMNLACQRGKESRKKR